MRNSINHEIPAELLEQIGMKMHDDKIFADIKDPLSLSDRSYTKSKIEPLEDAIINSGLKDGMTISFHHHFRGGDYIVNIVVDKLAQMGFKNLKLAASSLSEVHAPLIEHIKNGVITKIETSGMRGALADAISHGLMNEPVIFRSHGGRAAAIAKGNLHIDVAFLGVASCDPFGNSNGYSSIDDAPSMCGSLGYAKVDAQYADCTIILTDHIVPYPNVPYAIPDTQVNYIVKVDAVGNSAKISSGATRFTKNPRDLLIAETAAKVVENSGYFKDGFSIQTGSGGASLAVTRFIADGMEKANIKASFALGGITGQIVKLHDQGLIAHILDVQSFDSDAALSLKNNHMHTQIDANFYANPFNKGSAIYQLDVVILSALEVDTDFNVNVLTGSDGIIRGAIGGHPDAAAGAALTILVSPLIRGRIPCILDKVSTLVTPGNVCDVLVTDQGIAVNPSRPEIRERLINAGLKIKTIQELQSRAERIVGKPDPLLFKDKIVAVVTHRDGTVLDVVKEICD